MSSSAENGIARIPSKHSVDEVVEKLRGILQAKGVTLFALIDHSGEAAKVGLPMPPTKLVIFGNPKGGTPLMLASPSTAIDLPLKILVAEDASGGTWISYNSSAYLGDRHRLPQELLCEHRRRRNLRHGSRVVRFRARSSRWDGSAGAFQVQENLEETTRAWAPAYAPGLVRGRFCGGMHPCCGTSWMPRGGGSGGNGTAGSAVQLPCRSGRIFDRFCHVRLRQDRGFAQLLPAGQLRGNRR